LASELLEYEDDDDSANDKPV